MNERPINKKWAKHKKKGYKDKYTRMSQIKYIKYKAMKVQRHENETRRLIQKNLAPGIEINLK